LGLDQNIYRYSQALHQLERRDGCYQGGQCGIWLISNAKARSRCNEKCGLTGQNKKHRGGRMKIAQTFIIILILVTVGTTKRANAGLENALPSEYQPNNPDTSDEVYQSWFDAAKQFEGAKAALIAKRQIFIAQDRPLPLNQEGGLVPAGVHKSQRDATLKAQAECGLRIVVPKNAGYGGASCFDSRGLYSPFGLIGALNFDKSVVYGHQIMEIVPREGYKYDDYYIRPTFYIHEHGSFEQSLLGSAQLGADSNGLFMNWQMTPKGEIGLPKSTYVRTKALGGTQMIIGKAVWAHRYRGKTLYSTCIYSLHGHINRSAEALVCFGNVKGKSFTNKYVDEYLKVLDSIRLAP
jgi:hypothetical protein